MAEANAPKLGFTRRSFLKGVGGAAALSAAGVAGMTSQMLPRLRRSIRLARSIRRIAAACAP